MLVKDLKKCNNIYQVIYTDCPWSYRGQVQHGGAGKGYTSGANAFYNTLSVSDLCDMAPDIKRISDPEGCVLYMWYSPPILEDALKVMKAWGFKYKTCAFVWEKKRVNPGHFTMSQCEMVNVGTLKKIPVPRGARNIHQFLSQTRTSHSAKPLEVRHRINQMHPLQRKVELFSRFDQSAPNPGNWDDYGMQIGSVPWVP